LCSQARSTKSRPGNRRDIVEGHEKQTTY